MSVSNFCLNIFPHQGHDIAVNVCASISVLSQLCISIHHNLFLSTHLALKCCVVVNIGYKKINKLYEGLITTNPPKSNLRRHVSSSNVFFAFVGIVRKREWVCISFVESPSQIVVWRSYKHMCLPAALCTESIPTKRKVIQPRDSSTSSQMKSQGSHYASKQHINA